MISALERLTELWLARRNSVALMARGAIEVAPGHYPLIVVLHALWLARLWFYGAGQPVQSGWLAAFLALQVARIWVLTTLGTRWTTRIIVSPSTSLVARGPYRFTSSEWQPDAEHHRQADDLGTHLEVAKGAVSGHPKNARWPTCPLQVTFL